MKNVWSICAAVLLVAAVTTSCSKKKVRWGQLDGNVYEVKDVAVYDGVNYATWKNVHEGEVGDGGHNITSSWGTWDFSDPDNVVIDQWWVNEWDNGGTTQRDTMNYSMTGALEEFKGGALSFSVEADLGGGWTDYRWYQVHESAGKQLTVVFDELDTSDPWAYTAFVVLER